MSLSPCLYTFPHMVQIQSIFFYMLFSPLLFLLVDSQYYAFVESICCLCYLLYGLHVFPPSFLIFRDSQGMVVVVLQCSHILFEVVGILWDGSIYMGQLPVNFVFYLVSGLCEGQVQVVGILTGNLAEMVYLSIGACSQYQSVVHISAPVFDPVLQLVALQDLVLLYGLYRSTLVRLMSSLLAYYGACRTCFWIDSSFG